LQPALGAPRQSHVRTDHLLLVVNAHASGVGPAAVAGVESELKGWGSGVTTLVTESPEEWIDALGEDDERRVVLLGGDGTLHAAVNDTSARPDIAILPAGRANNVARSLEIPLDLRSASRLAVVGAVRPIDLAEAVTPASRYLTLEALSMGFLAEARSHYHADNSASVSAALVAGAHALSHFHPLHVHVVMPETTAELMLAQLFVANLPLYGFGLHVAPDADPTDRLLDVVAIEGSHRIAIPAMIRRLARGREPDGPAVHRWRTRWVHVEASEGSAVVADSLALGPGPVDVHVLPSALRLVRP
jgi:diacylglycerol kinase (ATP)